MTEVTIADTPEALTAAWVTDALRRSGHLVDASVTDLSIRPLGTGQMCDSVRVSLRYDGEVEAPASIVAKLPAADPTSRATAVSLRSYEKEVRFYQELAPSLPVRTPTVYHADIEPVTASFVLLLEDLAPAEQGDQLLGCSVEVAESAIDELVNLHAPRWGDAGLGEIEWLAGDPETSRAFMAMLLPTLWDGFRERYAADLEPHILTVGDVLFSNLEAYLTPSGRPTTVIHGDYRLDNLLLHPADGVRGVVDWQTCTVGDAMVDVAYFIGAGLREDDRRAVEADLVRRYHGALGAAGVADYTWDDCWEDYRRGTFAGLVMAIAASMLVERTDRGDEMFLTMATRHSRHALDLDAPDLFSR
jgi:hypothetical protein